MTEEPCDMKLKEGFSGTLSPEVTKRETEHRAIARRIAGEGIVLLSNDGVLPLSAGTRIALCGAGARHTIPGGTGSGEVNCRPVVSVYQGLKDAGIDIADIAWLDALDEAYEKQRAEWIKAVQAERTPGDFDSFWKALAAHPRPNPAGSGIPLEKDTEVAVYVISRIAGEGADRHPVKGDYLLSDTEEEQLKQLCEAYKKVIVILNVGGVIDLGFMDRCPVSALVLMSQAGMEGGNALADVLTGKVNPSGRLSETWAMRYEDYPCAMEFSHMNGNLLEEKYREGIRVGYRWFDASGIKPRYPYGFGLSYTAFERKGEGLEEKDGRFTARIRVANTGARAGRDTVLLFAACPEGLRKKERKRLIGYAKTPLVAPGESALLEISFTPVELASWHAGKSTWFLDQGAYYLFFGTDTEHFEHLGTLAVKDAVFGRRLHRICPLHDALPEYTPDAEADSRWAEQLKSLLRDGLPCLPMDDAAAKALDTHTAPAELPAPADPLVEKLTLSEKACLVCGRPRDGAFSFVGDAGQTVPGAAAESTPVLKKYGIPTTILADGPAGIRIERRYEVNPADNTLCQGDRFESMESRIFGTEIRREGMTAYYQFCTAIPTGMCLAQTFDVSALEEIGGVIAREMEEFGVTWWLAPGMNIKRNPLCGRNFEYYSEDPLHAGKTAAAITRGVQAVPGAAVTIKHFACNNQEDNRRGVSAVVSERALREIYLRGFEIAVREAQPHAIMTSYNKINGEHTANSRDLCTVAARQEWGFRGVIMTDWTTTNFEGGSSAAKCIAAGNDWVMPGLEHDIQEIMEAVEETNDQSLDLRDLDASCARLLSLIRQLCL